MVYAAFLFPEARSGSLYNNQQQPCKVDRKNLEYNDGP